MNQLKTKGFEQEIAFLLRRILRLAYLQSRRLVARYGLTAPQLLCLRALAGSSGLPPTSLAREVGLSRATLTGVLRRLETRGMVERSASPLDRRSSLFRLTPLGAAAASAVGSPLGPRFSEQLSRLSDSRKREICGALEALATAMEGETRHGPAAPAPAAESGAGRDPDGPAGCVRFPAPGRTAESGRTATMTTVGRPEAGGRTDKGA